MARSSHIAIGSQHPEMSPRDTGSATPLCVPTASAAQPAGSRRIATTGAERWMLPSSRPATEKAADLEVRLDVVVSSDHSRLQQRHRRVVTHPHQSARAVADLGDDRAGALHQRLLGDAEEVTGSLFDVGARLIQLFPRCLHQRAAMLGLDRMTLSRFWHVVSPCWLMGRGTTTRTTRPGIRDSNIASCAFDRGRSSTVSGTGT